MAQSNCGRGGRMAPSGSNKRMGAKAGFVPRFCHHDTRGPPSIFLAQKQEQSRISPSDTVVVLSGKWVPLVKMLKRWNRSAGRPIAPSFLIEVMAHQLIDPPFTDYPSEVRQFFAASLDGIMRDWPDPAGFGPPVSDQMTPQKRHVAVDALRQAEVKAARAVRLEQQGKNGEALALWREILGKYFPTS